LKPAWVLGTGLWAPGFDGIGPWVAALRASTSDEPRAAILPPRLVRRTSFLTRMAAEVLGQAAAGADLSQVMTVHASAYGEVQTLAALLEMLCVDGILSPARFQNSVHNTAGGHISIATANRAFSTALAAGPETVAMGLFETLALLDDRGGNAVVIFADEAPAQVGLPPFESLAVAVHLAADAPAAGALAQLSGLRRAEGLRIPEVRADFANNPVAPSLGLVEAIQLGRSGPVPLTPDSRGGWVVDLKTGEASR
jgi:hypothetical protein